ncbi:MAG: hypothetical protein HC843_14070 [Sphingomonadales bacterium]|nr:hypothetical protein [Sphingomonadales bacterium]
MRGADAIADAAGQLQGTAGDLNQIAERVGSSFELLQKNLRGRDAG